MTFRISTPGVLVSLMVACTIAVGWLGNSGTAGGSDSYGYISQADLWLRRQLQIPQPLAAQVSWPDGIWTLSPLGYRPSPAHTAIVPTYPPGLPMLMATAKLVAGQCGITLLVPIMGGLLVGATFGIARRLISDEVGAAAAWLVATSPAVLFMLMNPMSDVPAAALWAVAVYCCFLDHRLGPLAAGAAAAVALLVRPNLWVLAVVLCGWIAWDAVRSTPGRSISRALVLFLLPLVVASGGLALINRDLYGAATNFGYVNAGQLFSLKNVRQNLTNYGVWTAQSQTPLAALGLLALFVPTRSRLRGYQRSGRALLAALSAGVVGSYAVYLVFDAWWFLRLLLPCWPAVMTAIAWTFTWPTGRSFGKIQKLLIVALGLHGIWFAYAHDAFRIGISERRYVTVARLVRTFTEPNSVVFALQHSGSLRYYGGRMTLNYQQLDGAWLDDAVTWLQQHGMRPYFLLDDSERVGFKQQFARSRLGTLEVGQVFVYQGAPRVYLYDPLRPPLASENVATVTPAETREPGRCEPPVEAPRLPRR